MKPNIRKLSIGFLEFQVDQLKAAGNDKRRSIDERIAAINLVILINQELIRRLNLQDEPKEGKS